MVANMSTAAGQGWSGFRVETVPSAVQNGTSPAWSGAATRDLGGPQIDIWSNNHGSASEALIDISGASTIRTATQSGGVASLDTHGAAFSDIDGDGDDDLFEVSGRNNDNRLFINNGGTLTQRANVGAITDTAGRGRQPLFLDFDGDGDMDVVITNLDLRSPPVNAGVNVPSALYLNNGNGTSWTKASNDGSLSTGSLRVAQLTSTGPGTTPIVVVHNSFTLNESSIATGKTSLTTANTPATRRRNGPVSHVREVIIGDFDGDLHPEMLAVRGQAGVSGPLPLAMYDLIDGTSPRSAPALPTSPLIDNCRSAAAADFDNDGDLDVLAGCSHRESGQNRNVLLRNDGVGNFTIAGTTILPATIAETAAGMLVADIDDDGWMDAWVGNGYDFDRAEDHYLMNEGGAGNWLAIDLVGSNPDAMGAQVFLGSTKWQVRETGHRNHRAQDSGTLHFGLGSASRIAPVLVRWPNGVYESCRVGALNQRITLRQGSSACTRTTKAALLATLATAPQVGPPGTTTTTTAPTPAVYCAGRRVTVSIGQGQSPTEGPDVIQGTPGPDVINGRGGNDIICALGGNDVISGGGGHDRIFGDRGNDRISGGDGRDVVQGGPGDDFIEGGKGIDRLSGNTGADELVAGNGRDQLNGHAGNDRLFGGGGNDRMVGGVGTDFGHGGVGIDSCASFEIRTRCE